MSGEEHPHKAIPAGTHDADAVQVGRLTKAVVKCPCICACGIFTLTVALSILGFVVSIGRAEGNIGNVIASAANKVPDHPDQLRNEAFTRMREDMFVRKLKKGEEEDDEDPLEKERSFQLGEFSITYEDVDPDMPNTLTLEHVQKIIQVENALLDAGPWGARCKLAWSANGQESGCESPATILNTLMLNPREHLKGCQKGLCTIPSAFMNTVCGEGEGQTPYGDPPCTSRVYDWRKGSLAPVEQWPLLLKTRVCDSEFLKSTYFDNNATCTTRVARTAHTRSAYRIGWPLDGYRNREDRELEQENTVGGFFSRSSYSWRVGAAVDRVINEVSITPGGGRATYVDTPRGDNSFNVLTFNGLSSWFFIELLIYDAFFAIISFVFVFLYIWINVGSVTIAAAGMFEIVASIPLAYFFWGVMMNQVKVDFLAFLTVYLIMCIGADDIFVFMDSWRESATLPEHISGSLETRLKWTYLQAGGAMLITTATTVFCLIVTASSVIPAVSAFGIFTALVVLFDYLLVMSWFPCVVVWYTRTLDKTKCCACTPACQPHMAGGDEGLSELPKRVRFLRERVVPILNTYKYYFIAAAHVCIVVWIIVFGTQFKLSDEEGDALVKTNPIGQLIDISREHFFISDDWQYQVNIVYGLDTEAPISYPEKGQIIPDTDDEKLHYVDFDFNEEWQKKMYDDCKAGKRQPWLVHDREGYCILMELEKADPGGFPYKDEKTLRKKLEAFYKSARYTELTDEYDDWRRNTGFIPDGDDGIRAMWHTFNATIPREVTSAPASIQTYFEIWDDFVNGTCKPDCFHVMLARRPWGPGSASWAKYRFFEQLLREFGSSIGYSMLCAACLMLLATRNWIVTLCVMWTILSTVMSSLACVLAAGNAIGPQEAVFTVLTIGLSIDYAVHLSHFYTHADGTRYERVEESVTKVGISVIGGAITTACAGIPLFADVLAFFFKFGFFILFTSLWAIFYSFTLLLPLLLTIGPEGEQGSLNRFMPKAFRMRESVKDRRSAADHTIDVDSTPRKEVAMQPVPPAIDQESGRAAPATEPVR